METRKTKGGEMGVLSVRPADKCSRYMPARRLAEPQKWTPEHRQQQAVFVSCSLL